MWSVWDKKIGINGFSAEDILERFKHLQKEETIFVKTVNGKVTNIEGKSILAKAFSIDITLPNDAFIAEYVRIVEEIAKKVAEEA